MDYKYRNKLYGGVVGKYIGVIHGAEIESWTYEQIRNVYGEITDYPVEFENFCSDDDINGPFFYMRALLDFDENEEIPIEKMAHTLLNYVAENHGFFWWGGYGISTENTAYENLKNGIPAPLSGSSSLNGVEMSEQIGGQIFSDCWGLICPGKPYKAAKLAQKMSSITHDGNGVYGGMFLAACIAAAFDAKTMEDVINCGLEVIPRECTYAEMVRNVRRESLSNGSDFRKTFQYVKNVYGYDKYGGVCHIIPNGAIIVLSLVHGKEDFSNTLNICNMCGWDTDCNVGNVGTIMGVYTGADQIPEQWMRCIHDFMCASSVLGSLNIQTLSQVALNIAKITDRLFGIEKNTYDERLFKQKEGKNFHFEFPTAKHGIRIRKDKKNRIFLKNSQEYAYSGARALKVSAPYWEKGDSFELYYKTYYLPSDFSDSRYDPDFSPVVYPGDEVKARFFLLEGPNKSTIIPFIRERVTGKIYKLQECKKTIEKSNLWQEVFFSIPCLNNAIIEEIGWIVNFSAEKCEEKFTLFLDDVEILSNSCYTMEFSVLPVEKWNTVHSCVAHLTWLRGKIELENQCLAVSGYGKSAECYTGDVFWDNYSFKACFIPKWGRCHKVFFRVQGAMRSYCAGFLYDEIQDRKYLYLGKKYNTEEVIIKVSFSWEFETEYELLIVVVGNKIKVYVNGRKYIEYQDKENTYDYGCVGFGNEWASRTYFRRYEIAKLPLTDINIMV